MSTAAKAWTANFWSSAASTAAAGTVDIAEELGHATGLERKELEGKLEGKDPFHEAWLDAPFGTEASPVEVTSEFEERIVGVPDPDDDSLVRIFQKSCVSVFNVNIILFTKVVVSYN
ncbi:MAG: hypothetical protein KL787_02715 [Taibaiella sp.]|nr:hypothetical protein [Taibaiella sp.]